MPNFLASLNCRVTRAQDFGDCMSMVVDGSDNQEYALPYFCQVDKESSEGHKFKVLWKFRSQLHHVKPILMLLLTNHFRLDYMRPEFMVFLHRCTRFQLCKWVGATAWLNVSKGSVHLACHIRDFPRFWYGLFFVFPQNARKIYCWRTQTATDIVSSAR